MKLFILLLSVLNLYTSAYIFKNQDQQEINTYGLGLANSRTKVSPSSYANALQYTVSIYDQEEQKYLVLETDLFDTLIRNCTLEDNVLECVFALQENMKYLFEQHSKRFSNKSRAQSGSFLIKVSSISTKTKENESEQIRFESSKTCECLLNLPLMIKYIITLKKADTKSKTQIQSAISDMNNHIDSKNTNAASSFIQNKTVCLITHFLQSKKQGLTLDGDNVYFKSHSQFSDLKINLNKKLQILTRRRGHSHHHAHTRKHHSGTSSHHSDTGSNYVSHPNYSSGRNVGINSPSKHVGGGHVSNQASVFFLNSKFLAVILVLAIICT